LQFGYVLGVRGEGCGVVGVGGVGAVENGAEQLQLSSTDSYVSYNLPYSHPPLFRNDTEWKEMKTIFSPLFCCL
jgi:hypothetical protein